MSALATSIPKKRGPPPKYASAEEKKAANAERRRAQRKGNAASGAEQQRSKLKHIKPKAQGGPYSFGQLQYILSQAGHPRLQVEQILFGLVPKIQHNMGTRTSKISYRHLPITNNETITNAGGLGEAERGYIETISDDISGDDRRRDITTKNTIIDGETKQINKLVDRVVDQLVRHHGYCEHCHQQSQEEHAEDHENHTSLEEYLAGAREAVDYPDALRSRTMTAHESNFASQISGASRRYLYCGIDKDDISLVHICPQGQ
ncbi:hypothetical protein DM02DRAFT_677103 [Periconia macrospinosa]|uniref:Uncharacterized protein n=1 Tax=Periconia macrospinosa TaxID=97972 RepID=A0A2V1D4U2_9PLEO|nr:hypothetical protein DM02DRAFT_677103 [Periconia macrospinosa]